MEIISKLFFGYLSLVSSWWWIMIAAITFLNICICPLMDDDSNLSAVKASQLVIAGLLSYIPLLRNFVPYKLRMDFLTRWLMLGNDAFGYWLFVSAIVSILFAPVTFFLILCEMLYGLYQSTDFGINAKLYGFSNAVKYLLNKD